MYTCEAFRWKRIATENVMFTELLIYIWYSLFSQMRGSGYSLWFGSCTIITKNYSHFLCWTKLSNFLNEIKIWTSVGKFFLNNIKKRVSCRKVLSENLKPFLVVYFVRFICLDLTNNKGTKILVYSKYFRQRWFLNKRLRCWLNQTNMFQSNTEYT